jgi:hypothetical protein
LRTTFGFGIIARIIGGRKIAIRVLTGRDGLVRAAGSSLWGLPVTPKPMPRQDAHLAP